MNFIEKLAQASRKNHSLLCVGLDPDPALMPDKIGVFEFNRAIIDATADLVCAYKPNIAFYEAMGNPGLDALKRTRAYIPKDIPAIIDAKRGDIGNTAKAYARSLFDYFNFDAMTASPYLGFDSLEPFIQYRDRGVFILCRTSNAGAVDFQSLSIKTEGSPKMLFEIVAEKVNEWNVNGNLGLVVGATYPEELKLIREKYPEMPLLIPGVGAQGGELMQVVRCGADAGRQKTIINSSRQVLYASKGKDFAGAARKAAQIIKDEINELADSILKVEANTILIIEDDVNILNFASEKLKREGYKVIKIIDLENRKGLIGREQFIILTVIDIERFKEFGLPKAEDIIFTTTKDIKEKEYPIVLVFASTLYEAYDKINATGIFDDFNLNKPPSSDSLIEPFITILNKK